MRRLSLLLLAVIFVFGACVKINPKYEPTPSAGPWGSSGTSTSEIPERVYSNQTAADISAGDASGIIDRGSSSNVYILDLRSNAEFREDHIQDAVNLSQYEPDFDDRLKKFDKSKIYIIYCNDGITSAHVKYQMKNLGFETIYKIDGGFEGWVNAGLPSVGTFHKNVSPSDASSQFGSHSGRVIIDLRSGTDYGKTHINGAANIEYNSDASILVNGFRNIAKNTVIFLYSETGAKGESAMSVLRNNGYRKIYNIDGGIQRWINDGLTVWKHQSIVPVNNSNTNTAK